MDPPQYRPARQIPASLRDTLKIILEEELYLSGIDLLTSLIAQGNTYETNPSLGNADSTSAPPSPPPIYIPPPVHLTLLTTLLAHPTFTTHISRKSDTDAHMVPTVSERFLRRLLALAGPINMDLDAAWSRWSGTPSGSNGLWNTGGGRSTVTVGASTDDAFEDNALDLKLAGKESLFERVEDFWAVVGWGFTCACAEVGGGVDAEKGGMMRARWEAWKRVLCVLIEGLERDWAERVGSEEGEGEGEAEAEEREKLLRKSMIVRWLPSKRGGAGYKRVVRALMANGRGKLGAEWKEVWKDETLSLAEIRKRKKTENVKKPVALTAQEAKEAKNRAIFEDSTEDEDEDDDEDEEQQGKANRETDIDGDHAMNDAEDPPVALIETQSPPSTTSAWGGQDAFLLRQRLLILLSSVCHHQQWISLATLHDELSEHILSLAPSSLCLSTIRLFTTLMVTPPIPTTAPSQLAPPAQTYIHPLISSLLRHLLSSSAPSPSANGATPVDRAGLISPRVLKTCYLPYLAKTGTVRDNLRVVVLLEQLVRAIAGEGEGGIRGLVGEDGGAELVAAMEDGVERRMAEVVVGLEEDGQVGEEVGARQAREWADWEVAEKMLRAVVEVVCVRGAGML